MRLRKIPGTSPHLWLMGRSPLARLAPGSSMTCTHAANLPDRQSEMYSHPCCMDKQSLGASTTAINRARSWSFIRATPGVASREQTSRERLPHWCVPKVEERVQQGSCGKSPRHDIQMASRAPATPLARKHSFVLCVCLRNVVPSDECRNGRMWEGNAVPVWRINWFIVRDLQ